ncbi:uncharacterized protein LOC120358501 [Solenopsis invicta]|uniref:uncharacterized protein LOC120358501 n=1 Tax=Solenopsis invicta TaxID=13686 RepID=UPI00193D9CC9|nr:uncharacterized protein LOC120358501 [Solenopsis invicta]
MENSISDSSDIELSNTLIPAVTSPTPETLKPTLKTTKKQKLQNESIIQSALLDILKTPVPQTDAKDGFLKTLGETLCRLSYRKRTMMEIKFLQMALEAEEAEL